MKHLTTVALFGSAVLFFSTGLAKAAEYHVSTSGNDANRGSKGAPFRTIQRAADVAQPGDVITVQAGVYRERVNPPRGGLSDKQRIVYQAARGAKVEIKGSEVITSWTRAQGDVWKVKLPNAFFGSFNPYNDLIRGDWFEPRGRSHHTGAVYVNGHWLVEAAKLDEVLLPAGTVPAWWTQKGERYLLNIAWLRVSSDSPGAARIPAAAFAAQSGIQKAACSEGGECIGWIESGDWVRYDRADFQNGTDKLELRVASASDGGIIEIRLDGPDGELVGSVPVEGTGGWQSWTTVGTRIKRTSGVHSVCLKFRSHSGDSGNDSSPAPRLWFAQVDTSDTTLWAQFPGLDPNGGQVEINVRRTVFYPDQPGRNYITVRGFVLSQAATPWAPPTAEQVGLIGTHWSKGWIVEDNTVSYSICSGIALGKHGDAFDNTSANTAEGYVKTIERAHQRGWSKENIGHHVVRNNTISHCEQAGIVGSLGAAFSSVTGNVIHDIHVRRLFTGAEMAGIKFHGAIDTVIQGNHIYRTCLGLWLDWMAQGTRVSANLFHDNAGQDLFVEVDHGPFVIDNNLFLSGVSLLDVSEGGAYLHNLFNGKIVNSPEPNRETPYHPAHSTTVAGLARIQGGDDRFYNNIFVGRGELSAEQRAALTKDPIWTGGYGLWVYNQREFPLVARGNLYVNGSLPYKSETDCVTAGRVDPHVRLVPWEGRCVLQYGFGDELSRTATALVRSQDLGRAKVPDLPYETAEGAPFVIDRDFLGKSRGPRPTPGPFEYPQSSGILLPVPQPGQTHQSPKL